MGPWGGCNVMVNEDHNMQQKANSLSLTVTVTVVSATAAGLATAQPAMAARTRVTRASIVNGGDQVKVKEVPWGK